MHITTWFLHSLVSSTICYLLSKVYHHKVSQFTTPTAFLLRPMYTIIRFLQSLISNTICYLLPNVYHHLVPSLTILQPPYASSHSLMYDTICYHSLSVQYNLVVSLIYNTMCCHPSLVYNTISTCPLMHLTLSCTIPT